MAISTIDRLGFVGAGRVGRGLSLALSRCGYPIAGVASRARGDAQAVVDASDIVFLTVPDGAIEETTRKLARRPSVAAVHTSGAAELSVLRAAADAGAQVGGFHPLQMFADPEVAARGLRRHVEALGRLDPKLRELYCTLALRTVPLALGAGGIDAGRAEEIRKVLQG